MTVMTWTPADEQRARELLASASPRPWYWWTGNRFRRLSSDVTDIDSDVAYATVYDDGLPGIEVSESNAALIAEAPALLERALAEIVRLRDRERELEIQLEWNGVEVLR